MLHRRSFTHIDWCWKRSQSIEGIMHTVDSTCAVLRTCVRVCGSAHLLAGTPHFSLFSFHLLAAAATVLYHVLCIIPVSYTHLTLPTTPYV